VRQLIAVVIVALLTSPAWADPQSAISAYRKSYGLSVVTVDAQLTALASQQAIAMAEHGIMDHDVYAPFRSRITSYGTTSAAET
jgi:uncharacterized protein YkwD